MPSVSSEWSRTGTWTATSSTAGPDRTIWMPSYPRVTLDPTTYGGMGSEWFYNTTQWLYDASYGRVKTLTMGYTFKFNQEKKNVIKGLRVYLNGTNLLTFTKYPGGDPEIVRDHNGPQGRNISPNVTYLTPPQERIYAIGVNVDF